MDAERFRALLGVESDLFAAILERGELTAPVPGCGDWTLDDLARHLGDVHRWARGQVLGEADAEHPAPHGRDALVAWFREGAAALEATLDSVDPEFPCSTLADPPTARFWLRRQAHETSLHRFDAERSQGRAALDDLDLDAGLALDGVDEVLTTLLPRQLRLGRMPPPARPVRFTVPGGATWLVGDPRVEDPPTTVTAAPGLLLLALWKRVPLEDRRIRIDGDTAPAHDLVGRAITP